ncbi:UMP kinase [Ureaplasma diversum]|uniref:Uridylate kinase n=1 Tax=Ureaplasma diversum NCTC 246 TaxID=1188241 RepID=A0A084F137_9BACT|nr:UMP kinase [Ureaplasma diversum]KEZ23929.1 Uridylate kinase SmbA [Ureaplasma diversum NCTC 246]
MQKQRIVIKISGACLKTGSDSVIDFNQILQLANQIKTISQKYLVSIILGGGNIWRGCNAKELDIDRNWADNMGMMATIINGLAFQSALSSLNVNSVVLSAIKCDKVVLEATTANIENAINNDQIMIFVAGTGFPYFTTDSCAAIKAAETKSNIILMGKNGVDGIYNKDPNLHSDAKFYDKITFSQALAENLKVMDKTALALCEENNIDLIVFNIDQKDAIVDVLNKKIKHTIVTK